MNINEVYNSNQTNNTRQEELVEENRSYSSNTQQQTHKTASKVEKFSYHLPNAESKDAASRKVSSASTTAAGGQGYETQHQQAKKVWEERQALSPVHHHHQDQNKRTTNFSAESYQQHHHQQHHQQYHQQEEIYERRENLSFPELSELSAATIINRPALPPKTKIMNSPSRNIFSPTGSDHGGGDDSLASTTTTTASVKTVEFLPVREKVKLIAAQQEELCRREQEADPDAKRPKGVRILPPSPVTVRKMSVEEELYYYDKVVTRTTPVTQVMEQEDNRITGDIWGGKKAEVQVSKKEETGYQESSSSVKTMNFSSETKTTSSSFFASQQTAAAAQSAQWSGVQAAAVDFAQGSGIEGAQWSGQQTAAAAQWSGVQTAAASVALQSGVQATTITVPGWTVQPKAVVDEGNSTEALRQEQLQLQRQQQRLDQVAHNQEINTALDRLIAETESMVAQDPLQLSQQQQFQSYSSHAVAHTTSAVTSSSTRSETNMILAHEKAPAAVATPVVPQPHGGKPLPTQETPAEACRRSFEEAELEALALASETSQSFSKQSSIVETASVQSFVLQQEHHHQHHQQQQQSFKTGGQAFSAALPATNRRDPSIKTSEAESASLRKPMTKSNSFVRTPETFVKPLPAAPSSLPGTPLSQRRRLRINQSPKPPGADTASTSPHYRDAPSAPFQPGFYRAPPEDPEKAHVFQLVRRSSSRARITAGSGDGGRIGSGASSLESTSGKSMFINY